MREKEKWGGNIGGDSQRKGFPAKLGRREVVGLLGAPWPGKFGVCTFLSFISAGVLCWSVLLMFLPGKTGVSVATENVASRP